jgi:GT2 family glycosyltransferase
MILSVVIVNYNVKFFLEQCLSSLEKAVGESSLLRDQTEIFVIDNASNDGSMEFLKPLFPEIAFLQNTRNIGFAGANNLAVERCTGEFVLFLNPDTILSEDSLERCISFFRSKQDAGAIGVHMVDGAGRYLKESKRGFPGAWTSFFKMTGFAKLFPRSRIFSSYYLGHLDEKNSHSVDILSGAFLMIKKDLFDKLGGFDSRFFMYGEDIDLSYRILKEGYKNYYFSDTTIIHFKGESTNRDYRNTKLFYDAMILFMRKHFTGFGSSIRLFFLSLGVRMHQLAAHGFKLNSEKEQTVPLGSNRTVVRGDQEAREKWKIRLNGQNIQVGMEGSDEEIIFCECTDLPWKEIIKEISDRPAAAIYLFHGENTHAAVSSTSNRYKGQVFEL